MSFIETKFTYNGQSSEDFDVALVQIDTGMLQRTFGIKRSINKEKIKNRDVPYYYGSEKETYTIPITIAKISGKTKWTYEERVKIARWLFPGDDQFHEFTTEEYPQLIFYFQFTEAENFDNYNNEGYITLQAEMSSPYAYSPILTEYYDLSDNQTSTIIEVENMSNVVDYYYPYIQFTLGTNTTSFKIKNHSVMGEVFEFTNLTQGETITVDNANHQIISSTDNERISDFNFGFLRLSYGINRLEIFGKCTLEIKKQFPMMI